MAKKEVTEGWTDTPTDAPIEEAAREVLSNRIKVTFEDEGQELKYVVVEQTTSGRGKIIETPLIDNDQYKEVAVDLDSIVVGAKLISFYQGNPVEVRFAIASVENL